LELPIAAGICIIAGELLVTGTSISIYDLIKGFLVGFFISSSALILNDYFDIEADKINSPSRPIPSGKVKPYEVVILSIITAIIGFSIALFINITAIAIAVIFWIIGFLYNWKLKETGLLGNIMVSSSVAITFIFGGVIVGNPLDKLVWFFAFIVFFIDLGEEIASGAMDLEGDKKRKSKSIAIINGYDFAIHLSTSLFVIVIIISFIPFILQWLGSSYLIMIGLMDTIIIFSIIKLLKIENPVKGRKYLRFIYLGATISLVAFIVGQLII
jgi:geranylgeranylglycerol-phosphate geranylgeranyltransferase